MGPNLGYGPSQPCNTSRVLLSNMSATVTCPKHTVPSLPSISQRERGRPSFSLLTSLPSPPPRRHATWRPLHEEGLGPPRTLIARTWCCVPIINAPLSAWLFLILIYHFFYSKDHGHWLCCRVPLPPSMPFFFSLFFKN